MSVAFSMLCELEAQAVVSHGRRRGFGSTAKTVIIPRCERSEPRRTHDDEFRPQLPALAIRRPVIAFSSQPISISGTDDNKRSV